MQRLLGTANNLHSVYFINTNTGYSVGEGGTILKTTNGGTNWFNQSLELTNNLYSVYFINANIGYIVGKWRYNIKNH